MPVNFFRKSDFKSGTMMGEGQAKEFKGVFYILDKDGCKGDSRISDGMLDIEEEVTNILVEKGIIGDMRVRSADTKKVR
jgi:hypothetical protein